jgi:hypothetical protein
MDKAKMRLRSWPYDGVMALLLSHNELIDYGSLTLGTHVYSATDPAVHTSKHSGLGQMWVDLQYSLYQNNSIYPFIYCEVEQELRCQESDEHPKQLEKKATCGGITFDGYIKVQSAPYAYDQGADAKQDDPESAPLLWFCHPQIRRVARSGSISRKILHPFYGSVKTIDPTKVKGLGLYMAKRTGSHLYALGIRYVKVPLRYK